MLTSTTTVDRVEVGRFGLIGVRLRNITYRNGRLLTHRGHRLSFEPGAQLDKKMREIFESSLMQVDISPPEASQWKLVEEWIQKFHTQEVVEAQREWLERMEIEGPVSRVTEEDFGKTVFSLIGTDYLTEATPPGLIDRMVVARASISLPGREIPLPEYQVWPGDEAKHPATLRRYAARSALQNPEMLAGMGDDAIAAIDSMVEGGAVFDALGADEPEDAEWDRLHKVVSHVHTPKVVKAFTGKAAPEASPKKAGRKTRA